MFTTYYHIQSSDNEIFLVLQKYFLICMHFYCEFQDFIDLSPPDSGSDTGENVTAADVCLFGLNIIMPLMSAELLKFPNLCLQYFKTITFVCEIYPEKVTRNT